MIIISPANEVAEVKVVGTGEVAAKLENEE